MSEDTDVIERDTETTTEQESTDIQSSLLSDDTTDTTTTEETGASTDDTETPAAYFDTLPDDWRDQTAKLIAGAEADEKEVAKVARKLQRFSTFADFAKWGPSATRKINEGLVQARKLPDDATDEQVAEWRAANDVPEAEDKYELGLDGVDLSDDDRAVIGSLLPVAHKLNLSNAAMAELADAFFEERAAAVQRRQDQDGLEDKQAETTLRQTWGPDYERNRNVFRSVLEAMPEELGKTVMNARGPGGRALMHDPGFVGYMVNMQLEANPLAALVPSDGTGSAASLESEIGEIEKLMREDPDAYYKDDKKQARYRELLDARNKIKQN